VLLLVVLVPVQPLLVELDHHLTNSQVGWVNPRKSFTGRVSEGCFQSSVSDPYSSQNGSGSSISGQYQSGLRIRIQVFHDKNDRTLFYRKKLKIFKSQIL